MPRNGSNEVIELIGTIKHQTAKALFFLAEGADESYWIPLSQITKIIDTKTEGIDKITMKAWLARKLELV